MRKRYKKFFKEENLTIVPNINIGEKINKLFQAWNNVKTHKEHENIMNTILNFRSGNKSFLELIDDFGMSGNANSILKKDFITEINYAYKMRYKMRY
jgi:hypothetical protein